MAYLIKDLQKEDFIETIEDDKSSKVYGGNAQLQPLLVDFFNGPGGDPAFAAAIADLSPAVFCEFYEDFQEDVLATNIGAELIDSIF